MESKLVSKSPILRFKLGRKIVKFLKGGPWAGYYTVGNWPKTGNMSKKTPVRDGISPKELGRYNRNPIIGRHLKYDLENNNFLVWPGGTSGFVKDLRSQWELPINFTNIQPSVLSTTTSSPQVTNQEQTTTRQKNSAPSSKGVSFKNAFSQARNSGLQEFTWNGKRYNTKNRGEENFIFLGGKWVAPQQTPQLTLSEIALKVLPTPTINPIIPISVPSVTALVPQETYNRSQIRDFIRGKGINPYQFAGYLRKALRMLMNGQASDEDKAIVLEMGLFKKGGQLLSRNPIKRFKQK